VKSQYLWALEQLEQLEQYLRDKEKKIHEYIKKMKSGALCALRRE